MLRLADRWVWDFWLADAGKEFHLFYLQAPRSLGDPDLRHTNATIGHAVSTDLATWVTRPDALAAGPAGAWDDIATWTGSVVCHDGVWHMFYTGISSAEQGRIQRIGLATSPDLEVWTKHPDNPLIEADPRWYALLDPETWHDQAWRDPWILPDPEGHGFHALITARALEGPADGRGVIGRAWSADLQRWEVQPPVTEPGEFGELEVPQVVELEGQPYLLFSAARERVAQHRLDRLETETHTGIYASRGSSLLGPFDLAKDAVLLDDPSLYSGRIAADRTGRLRLLAFSNLDAGGRFIGEIADPIPVAINHAGELEITKQI